MAAFSLIFVLFWLVLMVICVGGMIYWIMKIVEVAKTPDGQFAAAGTSKTVWVLIVVLTGIIGALIWRFAERDKVKSAVHIPYVVYQPGWYPDPQSGAQRWFDGTNWGPFATPQTPPQPPPNSNQ